MTAAATGCANGWLSIARFSTTRVALRSCRSVCAIPAAIPRGADLPPRRECAPRWHPPVRAAFSAIELTLLVGSHAIYYYLPGSRRRSMTETVARWREFLPEYFVLPHPSWHTIRWLRDNAWFENEVLPELRSRVDRVLGTTCAD